MPPIPQVTPSVREPPLVAQEKGAASPFSKPLPQAQGFGLWKSALPLTSHPWGLRTSSSKHECPLTRGPSVLCSRSPRARGSCRTNILKGLSNETVVTGVAPSPVSARGLCPCRRVWGPAEACAHFPPPSAGASVGEGHRVGLLCGVARAGSPLLSDSVCCQRKPWLLPKTPLLPAFWAKSVGAIPRLETPRGWRWRGATSSPCGI